MLMAWDYGTKCTTEWLNADMGAPGYQKMPRRNICVAFWLLPVKSTKKRLKSEPSWLRLWTSSVLTEDKYMSPDHHIWVPWGNCNLQATAEIYPANMGMFLEIASALQDQDLLKEPGPQMNYHSKYLKVIQDDWYCTILLSITTLLYCHYSVITILQYTDMNTVSLNAFSLLIVWCAFHLNLINYHKQPFPLPHSPQNCHFTVLVQCD